MAMDKTETAVTMLYPSSRTLRALITLKLIINKVFTNFVHGQISDVTTGYVRYVHQAHKALIRQTRF
ncbi:hypothetical protein C4K31_3106 [Pseudomonas chlororaphis subsp. piscium]|nr:hypothetical protein C4K31_3106 [Pseudomonas chlororaphis subsp. piscium]